MRPFEGFEGPSAEVPERVGSGPRGILRPLRRAHLDSNLITEFFFVFSRFEYALKCAGYLKPGRNAMPNWDAFGSDVEESYNPEESLELAEAVQYLLSEPPKRQIVLDDGSLDWEPLPRENISDIRWLLRLVSRVRNNLFHGGKYPYRPLPEPARDTRLLESSLLVLEACLGWDKRVGRYFMSDLDE